jgi:hypothetical protein
VGLAKNFTETIPEHTDGARIPTGNFSILVQHDDSIVLNAFGDKSESIFARPKGFHGPSPLKSQ